MTCILELSGVVIWENSTLLFYFKKIESEMSKIYLEFKITEEKNIWRLTSTIYKTRRIASLICLALFRFWHLYANSASFFIDWTRFLASPVSSPRLSFLHNMSSIKSNCHRYMSSPLLDIGGFFPSLTRIPSAISIRSEMWKGPPCRHSLMRVANFFSAL